MRGLTDKNCFRGGLVYMSLKRQLDKLAAYVSNGFPFVSLYLNARAARPVREDVERFVHDEFNRHAKSFGPDAPERESLERDAGRIRLYLRDNLEKSTNGIAIFACAGAHNYFEAIQLDAPINEHSLYVSNVPQLYPLAHVIDQYPRYVALLADERMARLFVFDLGKTERALEYYNLKTSRDRIAEKPSMRCQHRIENHRRHHIKEISEKLEQVVNQEHAQHIVLAGDEAFISALRERFPSYMDEMVIDILDLDMRTPEHEILNATIESLREDNIQTDAEKVRELFDRHNRGRAAAVGVRDTMDALANGQVEELIISTSLKDINADKAEPSSIPVISVPADVPAGYLSEPRSADVVADKLVTGALAAGSTVTFIEDPKLLGDVGGVGAFLRYQI